jgi:hypothetical protein
MCNRDTVIDHVVEMLLFDFVLIIPLAPQLGFEFRIKQANEF